MNGALIRIGIDLSFGKWNAPVDPNSGEFVYVPIPESPREKLDPKLKRSFLEIIPSVEDFCIRWGTDLSRDLKFPKELKSQFMHLDPDFSTFTYGDNGKNRGSRIKTFKEGDFIAFYAGLKPISQCGHKILYALIGLFFVKEVVWAKEIPKGRWGENAHTRKVQPGEFDIVIRAKTEVSGRLDRCIPIGEWRDRAYRVKKDLLERWGGLSVKDGYLQRSAVPPLFLNPAKFYEWFKSQKIQLMNQNN